MIRVAAAAAFLIGAMFYPYPYGGKVNEAAPAPSGSYPDITQPWGYAQAECLSVYGKTAAQIEATPCSTASGSDANEMTPVDDELVSACSFDGWAQFEGDNITFDCVNWTHADDSSQQAVYCSDGGTSCQGITIRRSTMTGNEVPYGAYQAGKVGMDFFKLSTTYGQSGNTMLIEKSIIKGNRVAVLLGGGKFDKDVAAIEPGYAFILRESILRQPNYTETQFDGTEHSELIAFVETGDGVLIENNVLYCLDGLTCNTGNMLVQEHGTPPLNGTIENLTMTGNRIVGDSTGYMLTFNDNQADLGNCATNITFTNNEIETNGGAGVWLYGGCGNISSRGTCTGNTVDGGAHSC